MLLTPRSWAEFPKSRVRFSWGQDREVHLTLRWVTRVQDSGQESQTTKTGVWSWEGELCRISAPKTYGYTGFLTTFESHVHRNVGSTLEMSARYGHFMWLQWVRRGRKKRLPNVGHGGDGIAPDDVKNSCATTLLIQVQYWLFSSVIIPSLYDAL